MKGVVKWKLHRQHDFMLCINTPPITKSGDGPPTLSPHKSRGERGKRTRGVEGLDLRLVLLDHDVPLDGELLRQHLVLHAAVVICVGGVGCVHGVDRSFKDIGMCVRAHGGVRGVDRRPSVNHDHRRAWGRLTESNQPLSPSIHIQSRAADAPEGLLDEEDLGGHLVLLHLVPVGGGCLLNWLVGWF